MSVNCTNRCVHQTEGCCMLEEVPVITQKSFSEDISDCPYFKSFS